MTDLPDTDFTQRFIFDENDARGELVSLERSYAEVLAKHPYPEPVAQLLGELMAAASLLVGTMKFDGLLILQARSEGPVPMLMIECSSEREIRGLARYEEDQIPADATLADLMPNGVLALTIDPTVGQRYQGIVDLDGETLSDCFTNYFVMSQQVGTRFCSMRCKPPGLLLHQLPDDRIGCGCARRKLARPHCPGRYADCRRAAGPGQRNHPAPPVSRRRGASVRCAIAAIPLQLFPRAFGQCPGEPGPGRCAKPGCGAWWPNRNRLPVLQSRTCSTLRIAPLLDGAGLTPLRAPTTKTFKHR